MTLRTADDAVRLRAAAVAAGKGAPVVIVGGGFIGLEVASSLATLGLRPTVVELAPRCGPGRWASSWPPGRLRVSRTLGWSSGWAPSGSDRRGSRLDRRRAAAGGPRGGGRGRTAPRRARRDGRTPRRRWDRGRRRAADRPSGDLGGRRCRASGRTHEDRALARRAGGRRARRALDARPAGTARRRRRGSSPRSAGRPSTSSGPPRAGRRRPGSMTPDPSWPIFAAIASSGLPPSTARSPRMWAGGSSTPVPHRPRWRSRWPDDRPRPGHDASVTRRVRRLC